MINNYYLDPSHVTDEYAHRLQASATLAHVQGRSGESVVRQLFIRLGERLQGQRPAPVATAADGELATR